MKGLKNRGREEVPFGDCAGEEGMKEGRVLCLFLGQSLCSPSPRVGVVFRVIRSSNRAYIWDVGSFV